MDEHRTELIQSIMAFAERKNGEDVALLMRHRYTEDNLGHPALKGIDKVMVTKLEKAFGKFDLIPIIMNLYEVPREIDMDLVTGKKSEIEAH